MKSPDVSLIPVRFNRMSPVKLIRRLGVSSINNRRLASDPAVSDGVMNVDADNLPAAEVTCEPNLPTTNSINNSTPASDPAIFGGVDAGSLTNVETVSENVQLLVTNTI